MGSLSPRSLVAPDRPSISTLERAVWTLAEYHFDESITQDAIELAIRFAADVYWLTVPRLRRQVRDAVREISRTSPPPYHSSNRRVLPWG